MVFSSEMETNIEFLFVRYFVLRYHKKNESNLLAYDAL